MTKKLFSLSFFLSFLNKPHALAAFSDLCLYIVWHVTQIMCPTSWCNVKYFVGSVFSDAGWTSASDNKHYPSQNELSWYLLTFFFFSQRLNLDISFYILHRFSFKIIEFDFHPTLVAPEQFSGEGPINASVLIWFLISSRTRQNWKQRSVLTSWRKGQQGWTLPWWHTVTTWLTTPVLRSVELDNNRRTLRWMSFVSNGFSGFLIFQISAEILPLKKIK